MKNEEHTEIIESIKDLMAVLLVNTMLIARQQEYAKEGTHMTEQQTMETVFELCKTMRNIFEHRLHSPHNS